MGKKILGISGGSTAGSGLISATNRILETDFNPNIICGVSYGSLVGLPIILGKGKLVEEKTVNIKPKEFFRVIPMDKKGNLTIMGFIRLILSFIFPVKYRSFGIQDVTSLIREFISEDEFYQYKKSELADFYVLAVDVESMSPILFDIKNDESINYEKYIKILSASSRVPVWTQPQDIDGKFFYDGGVTDINPTSEVIQMLILKGEKIDKVWSVYPFTKEYKHFGNLKNPKGILGSLFWTLECYNKYCGINNMNMEEILSYVHQFEYNRIEIPRYLNSLYVTGESLKNLSKIARAEADRVIKSL